jgi:hypothetical protein
LQVEEEAPEYPLGSLVVALYDYDPASLSPNEDFTAELKFSAGDVFTISSALDEDGFYEATHRLTRLCGMIPSNFVSLYDPLASSSASRVRDDMHRISAVAPPPCSNLLALLPQTAA